MHMSSFVIYVFLIQQKEGKIYFALNLFLLVMVKHISIFKIFISIFTLCNLLDEVESIETINGKFIL